MDSLEGKGDLSGSMSSASEPAILSVINVLGKKEG